MISANSKSVNLFSLDKILSSPAQISTQEYAKRRMEKEAIAKENERRKGRRGEGKEG